MKTRTDIINYLIRSRRYASYLEIGMDNPESNFERIECPVKESVDPFDPSSRFCTAWDDDNLSNFLKHLAYRMTSDEFFAAYPDKKYDLIFIDGLHLESQCDKDIRNALRHLNEGGAVVVHDCLPTTEASQTEDNPSGDWVGTVWKSIVKYSLWMNCNVKVIDTDWGVGIIEYTDDVSFGLPPKLIMDYDCFKEHKRMLINILTLS